MSVARLHKLLVVRNTLINGFFSVRFFNFVQLIFAIFALSFYICMLRTIAPKLVKMIILGFGDLKVEFLMKQLFLTLKRFYPWKKKCKSYLTKKKTLFISFNVNRSPHYVTTDYISIAHISLNILILITGNAWSMGAIAHELKHKQTRAKEKSTSRFRCSKLVWKQ